MCAQLKGAGFVGSWVVNALTLRSSRTLPQALTVHFLAFVIKLLKSLLWGNTLLA